MHGHKMTRVQTTAAGGCGELRWGSPRRLPVPTQWSTYNAVERTASQPTGSQVQATLLGGWLAVAHFLRQTGKTQAAIEIAFHLDEQKVTSRHCDRIDVD
jgi:hypothetical protein